MENEDNQGIPPGGDPTAQQVNASMRQYLQQNPHALSAPLGAAYSEHGEEPPEHVKPYDPTENPLVRGAKTVAGKVSDWWKQMSGNTNPADQAGAAIGRGVVDAVNNTTDLAWGGLQKINHLQGWEGKDDPNPMRIPQSVTDRVLGKAPVSGPLSFVQGAATFATGMAAAEALVPEALAVAAPTSKLGATALTMAKGALADGTVMNPMQDRLSNLVQQGPSWMRNPITAFLASKPTDTESEGRLKNALEGLGVGATLDAFVAGARGVKAWMAGDKQGATQAIRDAATAMKAPSNDPVVVVQHPDGTASITKNPRGTWDLPVPEQYTGDEAAHYRRGRGQGALDGNNEMASPTKNNPYNPGTSAHAGYEEGFTHRSTQGEAGSGLPRGAELTADGDIHLSKARQADLQKGLDASQRVRTDAAVDGPTFENTAQAESHAAAANIAIQNEMKPRTLSLEDATHVAEGAQELAAKGEFASLDHNLSPRYDLSPDEAKGAIQAISEAAPDTKIQVSHQETIDNFRELFPGASQEDAITWLKGASEDSDKWASLTYGAREYIRNVSNQAMTLARIARLNPENSIAQTQFQSAMSHLLEVHPLAANVRSNSGRALAANRIPVGGELPGVRTGEVADAVGRAEATQNAIARLQPHEVDMLSRMVNASDGDPVEVMQAVLGTAKAKILQEQKPQGWFEQAMGYRMQAMLSGPKTIATHSLSNAISLVQSPAEYWWAGVRSNNPELRQQGADMLAGHLYNLKDSAVAARKAFLDGETSIDKGILSSEGYAPSSVQWDQASWTQKILPSRVFAGADEFFRQMQYRSNLRAQVLREAGQEGVTDAGELAKRVESAMQMGFTSEGGAVDASALAYAQKATFANALPEGSFLASYQNMVNAHPALRLATPFVRTPANLFMSAVEHTPGVNRAITSVRADLAAGGERAALAKAKTDFGAAIYSAAALAAYTGTITGSGPKDPHLRAMWLENNQPYSIKTPGGWTSYRRAEPIAFLAGSVADTKGMLDEVGNKYMPANNHPMSDFMASTADAVQASGEMDQSHWEQILPALLAGVSQNVMSKSFMEGAVNTMETLTSGDPHKAETLVANLTTSFVPNLFRQGNPDDTLRQAHGVMQKIAAQLPGTSERLEPRRNLFGEKVMKAPGYLNQAFNPLTVMKVHDQDVMDDLIPLGKGLSTPPNKIAGGAIDLTDRTKFARHEGDTQSPYDRWQELMDKPTDGGPNMRSALTEMVRGEDWKGMSQDMRLMMAQKVVSMYQRKAYGQMWEEYGEHGLSDALGAVGVHKAEGLLAPPPK